jgi:hypothetical protein
LERPKNQFPIHFQGSQINCKTFPIDLGHNFSPAPGVSRCPSIGAGHLPSLVEMCEQHEQLRMSAFDRFEFPCVICWDMLGYVGICWDPWNPGILKTLKGAPRCFILGWPVGPKMEPKNPRLDVSFPFKWWFLVTPHFETTPY